MYKNGYMKVAALCFVLVLYLLGCNQTVDQKVVRKQSFPAEPTMENTIKKTKQNLSMAKKLKEKTPQEYLLGPGDKLNVSVLGHSELAIQERISPLGTISFYLLGEVEAAGSNRFELSQRIEEGLKKYIKKPEVIVQVTEYQSQKIVVLGQVEKPGIYYLKGDLSLLEAITSAGGITESAHLGGSYLVRDGKVLLVNFYDLIEKANTEEDIPLLSGDLVYIPDNKDLKIFVLGEVNKQSSVQLRTGLTLFGAIAEAGGFTNDAEKESIVVMRGNLSQPEILLINAKNMLPEANVLLEQGDIIYVASSTFADIERIGIRLSHILRPFYDLARSIVWGDAAIGVLFEGKESRIVIDEE